MSHPGWGFGGCCCSACSAGSEITGEASWWRACSWRECSMCEGAETPAPLGPQGLSGVGPGRGVWRCLKQAELRNLVCADLGQLGSGFRAAVERLWLSPTCCAPASGRWVMFGGSFTHQWDTARKSPGVWMAIPCRAGDMLEPGCRQGLSILKDRPVRGGTGHFTGTNILRVDRCNQSQIITIHRE